MLHEVHEREARRSGARARQRAANGRLLLRLLLAGLVVLLVFMFAVSTWFEGEVVRGIGQVLLLIPRTLGWLIDSL